MKPFRFILLLSLFIFAKPLIYAQSEVCSLRSFWVERDPFVSSSWELVGSFSLEVGDRPVSKLMHHEDSGTDILLGVELNRFLDNKELPLIRLGLSFSNKLANVFDEINVAEAGSVYDKHWRFLSVTKNIEKEKRIYTFSFSCEKPKAKKR